MVSFLMIGSLILGLVSWIVPIINIIKKGKKCPIYAMISMTSCGIAISFQLIYCNHLVNLGQWSSLEDTAPTSVSLSVTLLVITIILNLISLIMHGAKKTERNLNV